MGAELLARATTTELVYEALDRYGPLSEREIGAMLSDSPRLTGPALNRLLTLGLIRVERTADVEVVLWGVTL